MRLLALLGLLFFAIAPAQAATDWNRRVAATAEGGWLIGNPQAPVKLVEYLSYTCPHCAHFAAEGLPALRRDYIAKGRVSLEVRQFALNPVDLTEGMLVRCAATPAQSVALGEAFLTDQKIILGKPPARADLEKLQALPDERFHGALAGLIGLDHYVRGKGLTAQRTAACLGDLSHRERIVAIRKAAETQYDINGTPSFLLNGKRLDDVNDWRSLEGRIKAALPAR